MTYVYHTKMFNNDSKDNILRTESITPFDGFCPEYSFAKVTSDIKVRKQSY